MKGHVHCGYYLLRQTTTHATAWPATHAHSSLRHAIQTDMKSKCFIAVTSNFRFHDLGKQSTGSTCDFFFLAGAAYLEHSSGQPFNRCCN